MTLSRTHIGLVFGGASGEHAVSIRSAQTVLRGLNSGLNRDRYQITTVYIDQQGRWWGPSVADPVLETGLPAEISDLPQPLPSAGFRRLPAETENVAIWYPVLHGPNGEDGTVQGLFRLMRQPFIGASARFSGEHGQAGHEGRVRCCWPGPGALCAFSPRTCANVTRERTPAHRSTGLPVFRQARQPRLLRRHQQGPQPIGLEQGLEQAAALDPRLVVEQGVNARELNVPSSEKSCMPPWWVKSVSIPTGTTTTRSTPQGARQR